MGCRLLKLVLRRNRRQLHDLIAQGRQLQVEPGTVRLFGTAQRGKALGQLLARGVGTRIALLAKNLVGALDQRLRTVDVLQGRQAQARQTNQVFGFCQAPVLAAGPEHGFQALAQTLLVALQLGQQAAALLQLVRARQLRQACSQLLLALLEGLGLVVEALYLAQLLLVAGLQGADLPDPPPAGGNARSTQQQGDDCQAIATARRSDRCLARRIERGLSFIFRQGCFAHVSILCVSESGNGMAP